MDAELMDDDDYAPTEVSDFLAIDEIAAAANEQPRARDASPGRDVPVASDMTWEYGRASSRPHTQIHPRCGACQMPFQLYERMVASKYTQYAN